MSEAGTAVPAPSDAKSRAPEGGQNRVTELKVSGHLMTLEPGLFCVFQAPGPGAANDGSGLPGVRISLPPGEAGHPEQVSISTFRNDGWLNGGDAAALVRVSKAPAQVLVTVYQAPTARPDSAPRLQVMRLGPEAAEVKAAGAPGAAPAAGATPIATAEAEVVAHVQRTGDVGAHIGDWVGTRGSGTWIEGFSFAPQQMLSAADVEYQAVLGRGWLSPWIEGGKFCGSRGMALPLLGLKIRLKGAAAKTHECFYSASFVDGSTVGPVRAGETCESESLAALEAFQITVEPRGAAAAEPERVDGAAPKSRSAVSAPKPTAPKPTSSKTSRSKSPASTSRRTR